MAVHGIKRFGEHVREAREAKGWSQERLAEQAGVSQTTIDKIERGETKRSRFTPDIAHALEIPVERLTRETTYTRLTDKEAEDSGFYGQTEREIIPVLYAFEDKSDRLSFQQGPWKWHEIPPFVGGSSDGVFALHLLSTMMSPEFESGDILYIKSNERPNLQRPFFFMDKLEGFKEGIFGRLVHYDDDYWRVMRWRGSASVTDAKLEEISRREFPAHFRVVSRCL